MAAGGAVPFRTVRQHGLQLGVVRRTIFLLVSQHFCCPHDFPSVFAGLPIPKPRDEFLVVSQPSSRSLAYIHLHDDQTRSSFAKTLIGGPAGSESSNNSPLHFPLGVAFDPERRRLFVADAGAQKIVYFTVQIGDGASSSSAGGSGDLRLVTDGRPRVAVDKVLASDLAVAKNGDLYFSGVVFEPTTPASDVATSPSPVLTERWAWREHGGDGQSTKASFYQRSPLASGPAVGVNKVNASPRRHAGRDVFSFLQQRLENDHDTRDRQSSFFDGLQQKGGAETEGREQESTEHRGAWGLAGAESTNSDPRRSVALRLHEAAEAQERALAAADEKLFLSKNAAEDSHLPRGLLPARTLVPYNAPSSTRPHLHLQHNVNVEDLLFSEPAPLELLSQRHQMEAADKTGGSAILASRAQNETSASVPADSAGEPSVPEGSNSRAFRQVHGIFRHPQKKIAAGEVFDPALVWDAASSAGKAHRPGPVAVETAGGATTTTPASSAPAGTGPAEILFVSQLPSFVSYDAAEVLDADLRQQFTTYGTSDRALTSSVFVPGLRRPANVAPPSLTAMTQEEHTSPLPAIFKEAGRLIRPVCRLHLDSAEEPLGGANELGVKGLAVSSRLAFFSTANSVFAVEKREKQNTESSAASSVVSNAVAPRGLAWDGEGTLFVADNQKATVEGVGGVYRLPAGEFRSHEMDFVSHVADAYGVAYVRFPRSGRNAGRSPGNGGLFDVLAQLLR
eukprot:CAMPEP_0179007602 /NCGR_PEP_ID=MMETSP0795-20121207/15250_1 /TAXON_ID=88552 /ORGANISM="Amoebophrya sp., Strain Ameob2" /LENGTH=734 /DNA_ID=CAMNT_0020702591 /DNA_START=101 /DNA_END=2305 /DNA_ORIENTATION=+